MELIGAAAADPGPEPAGPPCPYCHLPKFDPPHIYHKKFTGEFWECPDEPDW